MSSEEWCKAEIKRLDRMRAAFDEAHKMVKELLDEAFQFRRILDSSGVKLFREIQKQENKDSILHKLSSSTLSEYAGRLEAERLAVLLGKCLKQPRPRGALAALQREFPKWRTMLRNYESRADD